MIGQFHERQLDGCNAKPVRVDVRRIVKLSLSKQCSTLLRIRNYDYKYSPEPQNSFNCTLESGSDRRV